MMEMCIHSQIGVVEVLRWLLEEARGLFGHGELAVATSGAISSARARLGSGVLETLYRRIVGPVALKRTRGAWHGELRVVALDGSTLELQDSPENARHYGYAAGGRGECAGRETQDERLQIAKSLHPENHGSQNQNHPDYH
jgi:hypothetical protein